MEILGLAIPNLRQLTHSSLKSTEINYSIQFKGNKFVLREKKKNFNFSKIIFLTFSRNLVLEREMLLITSVQEIYPMF